MTTVICHCPPAQRAILFVVPDGMLDCVPCDAVTPPAAQFDCEFVRGCDDVNGDGSLIEPYLVQICTSTTTGAIVSGPTNLTLAGLPYAPVNPVACADGRDLETVETCFRDGTNPSILYTRVVIVDPVTAAVVATLWLDSNGAVVPAPVGAVPCAENGDRIYSARTSNLIVAEAFAIPAPPAGQQLRSFTLMVREGLVTLLNGPDAGSIFPPGTYSWAAPVTAPGLERGFLSFLPSFTGPAGTEYMVNWTHG